MSTIIIGAGIMGLLCARSLAKSGRQVILLEKAAKPCTSASWAGGGMGMPLYPWHSNNEIMVLVKRAYNLYPNLIEELLSETGIDAEWQVSGLLSLGIEEYPQAMDWAHKFNFPLQLLEPEQIEKLAPALALKKEPGLWLPSCAQLRNPRLLKALRASIQQQFKVELLEAEVENFVKKHDVIVGVQTTQGFIEGQDIVICAGAWSGKLLAQLNVELPIYPIRGQMLLWKVPEELLSCMVVSQGKYLIPRKDGHILMGSSMENVGFDNTTTEQVHDELYQKAVSMVPDLRSYPVVSHWAGLRPASPEGIPYTGKVPGLDNVWINTGHFRNGLLMAPASNEILITRMLHEK